MGLFCDKTLDYLIFLYRNYLTIIPLFSSKLIFYIAEHIKMYNSSFYRNNEATLDSFTKHNAYQHTRLGNQNFDISEIAGESNVELDPLQ